MKAFMAVASELSFGRAAQQLHLAQPAVTAQIHNLEKYLGVKLFERNNRGVRLTDAGEAFLEPCRAALQAIDAAATQARNGGTGEYGTIKIGFNVAFSIDPLVPLTRAVRTSYPGLKLQIDVPRRNGEIVRMVERQELHLGLIGGSATGEGLGSLPIGTARLCVVVPRDHRLADLPEVAIPMLTDEPLVLASVGPDTVRSVVEHAFEVAGHRPTDVTDVPDISGVLALVTAGVGVGFTLTTSSVLTPGGLTMIPLAESVDVPTSLVWRAGRETRALDNVLRLARTIFG